eukprot:CAMPEP_0113631396 /NCGR_PEP_ID=MMETSP0017_2-20120614/16315_1 /TAXON_ID=2856 /ORGANISM="Cylindrotheca closterium" /LENGTH=235 /DNA_ID=CAMNT_0000541903 /DNA_START=72 /DNA_END=779 /DNA_ORIENTATION=- /assembly_acc=CAM_ASM_000147
MKYISSILAIVLLMATIQVQSFSPANLPPHRSSGVSIDSTLGASSNSWMPNGEAIGKVMASGVLAASLVFGASSPALAAESTVVGELKGSGLVFKDTLQIERFDDPKVKGVTLYISNFQRPITEKLNKGFFNDPSTASVACAKTGKVSIADNINKSTAGEEVFKESKSLLFKSLRVQRIYDTETNTMVYVSFNSRLDKGDDSNKSRFASSLCAVNLDELTVAAPAAPATPPPAAK